MIENIDEGGEIYDVHIVERLFLKSALAVHVNDVTSCNLFGHNYVCHYFVLFMELFFSIFIWFFKIDTIK